MEFLTSLFGSWSKKTQVEASNKKTSLKKAIIKSSGSRRAVIQQPEYSTNEQLSPRRLVANNKGSDVCSSPRTSMMATAAAVPVLPQSELPKGWKVSDDNTQYVHVFLGETRSLDEPPTIATVAATMKPMKPFEDEEEDELNKESQQQQQQPQQPNGYPHLSDLEAIGRKVEEKFNAWLVAFDRVYVETGDLLHVGAPSDGDFKEMACNILLLMNEFASDVLRERLVQEPDLLSSVVDFQWEEHYVTNSVFSTPSEISKDALLKLCEVASKDLGLKTSLNKLWGDSKALRATRNLMVELYRLRTACELLEPKHRLLSETLNRRVPLILDQSLHKRVGTISPTPRSRRVREGMEVTIVFPAVSIPSRSNTVVLPALVY